MAFERNYVHRSKHAPWGGGTGAGEIVVLGKDWSGAAFKWSFGPAVGSAADITLVNAAAGAQGVSATYDANYVHPDTGAIVGATTIVPQIDEATLEGLAWGGDPTAALVKQHELLVTPAGEPQRPYAHGTFTLYAGIGD